MSKRIALVACVSKKIAKPTLASELYISPWFNKAAAYAGKVSDAWFILSAKYGLVHPSQVIDPYELTLNSMNTSAREEWASKVFADLMHVFVPGDVAMFLAGNRYRKFLVVPMQSVGVKVEIPMAGLRIGEQLQWLNQQLGINGE